MKFAKFRRKKIVIPLLMFFEIFLGIVISLIITQISRQNILNNINIINLSNILFMLIILLFIICCILVLVKYFQKEEEHKIISNESAAPVPANLESKQKFPRRRAIVNIGLVVAGFAAAFIVQTIIGHNPKSNNSTTPPPPPEVIKFAILPTLDFKTSKEQQNWNTFIQDMEQQLGIPVGIFPVNSYTEVIEAINDGEAQIAWFGGNSYIEAAKQNKIKAFAQTVNDDGSRGYYSYLIANKNNPIVSQFKSADKNQSDKFVIDAIKKGKLLKFAFTDENSTSGFLVPNLCVFAKNGIQPQKFLKNPPSFLGNHEATALAVADERVDVATNNSEALVRLERSHPQDREKIEVIWKSRIIPSDPIAYRKDLPEKFKTNIQKFFYNYNNQNVLQIMGWKGFEPADDGTWDIIRQLDGIAEKIRQGTPNIQLQAEAQSICSPLAANNS